jgi:stearoyl-CoA desaturase (delta-9 desaturase)
MAAAEIVLRDGTRIPVVRAIPFTLVHLACFAAFLVEFRWWYPILTAVMYYSGMFWVTAGYHRYFSHRSFKTSRAFQFFLAFMAMSSAQKGVLWWAAHHRHHHKFSDTPEDIHSPVQGGFWWSHVGWILSDRFDATRSELVPDLYRYPELRWLNKYHLLPPVVMAVALFLIGGWGLMVWGFFIRTVLLWHGSFTVNSLAHVFGRRRYPTADTSKNSFLLALITMGEGWHNNHHHFMAAARQGFFWWEFDPTFYILKVLSWCRIVWDLRPVPAHLLVPGEA